MRSRFDEDGNPDIKVVVAEYRDAVRKRLRWAGPAFGGIILLLLAWSGVYSINPGEVGVVRTFGKETSQSQPGLHFIVPLAQRVDIVDLAKIRRTEIGFKTTPSGPKRIDSEALMLTGDENIIEAQMIVQYQIADPSKYLFKLKDPEASLHIAAEVALRGVVGQMRITSSIEELSPSTNPALKDALEVVKKATIDADAGAPEDGAGGGAAEDAADAGAPAPEEEPKEDPKEQPKDPNAEQEPGVGSDGRPTYDPNSDILTTGRERAQVEIKIMLQQLMDLYESGLKVTEVKLQVVDAPDEVKDAFHDVVRAREEREQKINEALGYREDRIPKVRGEAQKILRAAEGYKQERVLRSQGEATRFRAILAEYKKAKNVTRQRLHLETMERILSRVPKKVLIDDEVAKGSVPILPLGNVFGGGAAQGGANR